MISDALLVKDLLDHSQQGKTEITLYPLQNETVTASGMSCIIRFADEPKPMVHYNEVAQEQIVEPVEVQKTEKKNPTSLKSTSLSQKTNNLSQQGSVSVKELEKTKNAQPNQKDSQTKSVVFKQKPTEPPSKTTAKSSTASKQAEQSGTLVPKKPIFVKKVNSRKIKNKETEEESQHSGSPKSNSSLDEELKIIAKQSPEKFNEAYVQMAERKLIEKIKQTAEKSGPPQKQKFIGFKRAPPQAPSPVDPLYVPGYPQPPKWLPKSQPLKGENMAEDGELGVVGEEEDENLEHDDD